MEVSSGGQRFLEGPREALDDDVVGRSLVILLASERVVAVGIVGGLTFASRTRGGAVYREAQFAEESVFEGVVAKAVTGVAARHRDEWVRHVRR